jgi:hypothetical protein
MTGVDQRSVPMVVGGGSAGLLVPILTAILVLLLGLVLVGITADGMPTDENPAPRAITSSPANTSP